MLACTSCSCELETVWPFGSGYCSCELSGTAQQAPGDGDYRCLTIGGGCSLMGLVEPASYLSHVLWAFG